MPRQSACRGQSRARLGTVCGLRFAHKPSVDRFPKIRRAPDGAIGADESLFPISSTYAHASLDTGCQKREACYRHSRRASLCACGRLATAWGRVWVQAASLAPSILATRPFSGKMGVCLETLDRAINFAFVRAFGWMEWDSEWRLDWLHEGRDWPPSLPSKGCPPLHCCTCCWHMGLSYGGWSTHEIGC